MKFGGIKKRFLIFSLLITLFIGLSFFAEPVLAQGLDLGLEPAGALGLGSGDIRVIVASIIRVALSVLGIIALVLILYGGFVWMTAGGATDKIDRAKKIIFNGAIGLVIILASYAIASFVISRLTQATGVGEVESAGFEEPGGGGAFDFGQSGFYLTALPIGGEVCIRNVHPSVTFNREVNIGTVNSDSIKIIKLNADGQEQGEAPGLWQWPSSGEKNTAEFTPLGDCGGGPNDCLEPSTRYVLRFTSQAASNIKSLDTGLSLNCQPLSGGVACDSVEFTTGQGVDRNPPSITGINIISVTNGSSELQQGDTLRASVDFVDDNGVQRINLKTGDFYVIASESLQGCQSSGSVDLEWNTLNWPSGDYNLEAIAYDWAMLSDMATTSIKLLPPHCFNGALDEDKGETGVDCGGSCRVCGGGSCVSDSDCLSGRCVEGVCVDVMRITSVSPLSGAVGTYISIGGYKFGSTLGKVFMTDINGGTVEAPLADCGSGRWTDRQIIAVVPDDAADGPIIVETAAGESDRTDSAPDPFIEDFTVNDQIRPGLCAINPSKARIGKGVVITGKNLGGFKGAEDKVLFGNITAQFTPESRWTDRFVSTTVPVSLGNSILAVKVVNEGVESNGLRFEAVSVNDANSAFISEIFPAQGAKGEYITITGKNFGDTKGEVKFFDKADQNRVTRADLNFPPGCDTVWNDRQIIVKFPTDQNALVDGISGHEYYVQVQPANSAHGFSPVPGPVFELTSGQPSPGICSVQPQSGPSPLPEGMGLELVGEYFGSVKPSVYFWQNNASPDSIDGRLKADSGPIKLTYLTGDGQKLSDIALPDGVASGLVVVYRDSDSKMSNGVPFDIYDCRQNDGVCSEGYQCCGNGVCIPENQLCLGQVKSAGYMWRFSTQGLPKVPHVVERCGETTESGEYLPTPSPAIQWDGTDQNGSAHNVCRQALVVIEFDSAELNQITSSDIVINKCVSSTVDQAKRLCSPVEKTVIKDQNGNGEIFAPDFTDNDGSYLAFSPVDGQWEDNTWYQVVLSNRISAGSGNNLAYLAKDKPCSQESAYCFLFRSDQRDCRVRDLVVTPSEFRTNLLASPIEKLKYHGYGLSDQKCVAMDISNYNWNWRSANVSYADIYGPRANSQAQASALANTVAIGLTNPEDAVNIIASVSNNNKTYSKSSPLSVDLSDPKVSDYWPTCMEACPNTAFGVRFNVTLSERNLSEGIRLYKCDDENCLNTQRVGLLYPADMNFDTQDSSVINIDSSVLEPNTLYKVEISSDSDNINDPQKLWSRANLSDLGSYSKPYNDLFSWRFRTKQERCLINRVDVLPELFTASYAKERKIYKAEAFSSPDSCDVNGQKLDPYVYDWDWSSSDVLVATVTEVSTRVSKKYCDSGCIRKGSDYPVGTVIPLCGNGIVEAGEDCDAPNPSEGCSLKCLRTGNTDSTCGNGTVEPSLGEECDKADPASQIGCSDICLHEGSARTVSADNPNLSVCGSGQVGSGEDCDTGIKPLVSDSQSAMNCGKQCLHTGTKLSSRWCVLNADIDPSYQEACQYSVSVCGDGVITPDEDPGCDLGGGKKAAWCNDYCLRIGEDDNGFAECVAGSEGCDKNGQHIGSSYRYENPSFCGDGIVGAGEDDYCETDNLTLIHQGLTNPWVLVSGQGESSNVSGTPPKQTTKIAAATLRPQTASLISDSGDFSLSCGYKTDAECQAIFGSDYGLASNSCCYTRPNLVDVYPGNLSSPELNICPNTVIEAEFDKKIDSNGLRENILLVQGYATSSPDHCSEDSDLTSLLAFDGSSFADNQAWYKKIFSKLISFFKKLIGSSVSAAPPSLPAQWCLSPVGINATVKPSLTEGNYKIKISLARPLEEETYYGVILKGGIKSDEGIGIANKDENINWKFYTSPEICEIKSVSLLPEEIYLSRAGEERSLRAEAINSSGQKIQPIPGYYNWEFKWAPTTSDYYSLGVADNTSGDNSVIAKNRNGVTYLAAIASITQNRYTPDYGDVANARSKILVNLCENPWPPKEGGIYPYEDKFGNNDEYSLTENKFTGGLADGAGYYNFSLGYCADNGATGVADDLPYLRPAIQPSYQLSEGLKRFFFTNSKNNDVIGIQIFPNPNRLSPLEWYRGQKEFTGNATSLKVDGYNAVTDGNSIYVEALNFNYDPTGQSNDSRFIYSNIYLFSINADAQPETREVFNQLMSNLKLNINLTDFNYCGSNADNPETITPCLSDLDCQEDGYSICSAKASKLKRNYARLKDLRLAKSLVESQQQTDNGYPRMEEGTYLSGQTLSVWESWSRLGTVLGKALNVDPVNTLKPSGTCKTNSGVYCVSDSQCSAGDTCALHDPVTGWSIEGGRYSFSCNPASLAYRYIYDKSVEDYKLYVKLEDPFSQPTASMIANWGDFMGGFIGYDNKVVVDGICLNNQEVSGVNIGQCGDGVLNISQDEQCDPPGMVDYNLGTCVVPTWPNPMGVKRVCQPDCHWGSSTAVSCSVFGQCGNGMIEPGEICDDGPDNGSYNSCDIDCLGRVDSKTQGGVGYCGDGFFDIENEICDASLASIGVFSIYSPEKERSCSFDCQNYGFYCGDGVVQNDVKDGTSFGANEQCEQNQSCLTEDGRSGIKKCDLSTCRFEFDGECRPEDEGASAIPSNCGNGSVEADEICDNGSENGVKCEPDYEQSCAYCSRDCRNIIDVQSTAYCGNGIVEAEHENCDYELGLMTQPENSSQENQYVCSDNCRSSYGGYCGDGIVQTTYGENCDPEHREENTGIKDMTACQTIEDEQPCTWGPSAISGKVLDASKSTETIVSGVLVELFDKDNQLIDSVVSDSGGRYNFDAQNHPIPSGQNYKLRVSKTGYTISETLYFDLLGDVVNKVLQIFPTTSGEQNFTGRYVFIVRWNSPNLDDVDPHIYLARVGPVVNYTHLGYTDENISGNNCYKSVPCVYASKEVGSHDRDDTERINQQETFTLYNIQAGNSYSMAIKNWGEYDLANDHFDQSLQISIWKPVVFMVGGVSSPGHMMVKEFKGGKCDNESAAPCNTDADCSIGEQDFSCVPREQNMRTKYWGIFTTVARSGSSGAYLPFDDSYFGLKFSNTNCATTHTCAQ